MQSVIADHDLGPVPNIFIGFDLAFVKLDDLSQLALLFLELFRPRSNHRFFKQVSDLEVRETCRGVHYASSLMQVVLVLALNLAETGIKKTAACKSSLVCSCIRCAQTHKSLILILTLRDSRSFNVVEKRLVSPAASRVGPLMHAPIKQRSIHML